LTLATTKTIDAGRVSASEVGNLSTSVEFCECGANSGRYSWSVQDSNNPIVIVANLKYPYSFLMRN
jgi:hypothetical protein